MPVEKKETVRILGVEFPVTDKAEIREIIKIKLDRKGTPTLIFTPNTDILLRCAKSRKLTALINSADISLPDGGGVVIASKILGNPLHERISGIDTGEFILSIAADMGLSVYFLGGRNETAKSAAANMRMSYPGLKTCGAHHGYFSKTGAENDTVIAEINSAQPDIIFVCFGFPAQEAWLYENAAKIPSLRLGIGLGGSFDVWSGNKKRAPALFRKLYLEWLWRGFCEPRRLKIILRFPEFFFRVLAERFRAKKARKCRTHAVRE